MPRIEAALSLTPTNQTFTYQQKPSETDEKIYCFVVLKKYLTPIAVVAAVASIIFTVAIHPVFLIGTIPAIALLILKGDKVEEKPGVTADEPPVEIITADMKQAAKAGVVGLGRMGCNCWANALMQFVMHNDRLRQMIETSPDAPYKPLKDFIKTYIKATGDEGKPIDKAETQKIREFLHAQAAQVPEACGAQFDATEALNILAQLFSQMTEFRVEVITTYKREFEKTVEQIRAERPRLDLSQIPQLMDGDCRIRNDAESQLFLSLEGRRSDDFLQLIEDHLDDRTGNKDEVLLRDGGRYFACSQVRAHKLFQNTPHGLFVTLKRFQLALGRTTKIKDEIAVPQKMTLPGETNLQGKTLNYELDFFFVHTGNDNAGHYISYVKKGSQWYECNDSSVTLKTNAEIDAILKTSYSHHYRLV